MRRINILGGPGIGKSTVAAWLFVRLKQYNFNIELVNEWIKAWAWQGIKPGGFDQLYIFAKQLRKEDIVLRHGGIVVSDSPLLMQLAYVQKYNLAGDPLLYSLLDIESDYETKYPSINIMIDRSELYQYSEKGRFETLAQAKEMDIRIHRLFEETKREHQHFDTHDLNLIGDYVIDSLESGEKV